MAQCDMCGKEAPLLRAEVEGAILSLCTSCSSYGKVLYDSKKQYKPKSQFFRKQKAQPEEITYIVCEGFGAKIREKREHLNIKQIELAKKLAEKESIIHKLESEDIQPSLKLAHKIQKILGIKILEEVHDDNSEDSVQSTASSGALTIGDMIKIKKR